MRKVKYDCVRGRRKCRTYYGQGGRYALSLDPTGMRQRKKGGNPSSEDLREAETGNVISLKSANNEKKINVQGGEKGKSKKTFNLLNI